MPTLKFPVTINAAKEKVWETLWNDGTYRQWTEPFFEGSYAESDWNEGSKILFLEPGGNGMYAVIEKKIPNEQMIFRHLGDIKNGVEVPKNWKDAFESYYLADKDGITSLQVEMKTIPEFTSYLNGVFPKALGILKQLCEQ